MNNEIRIISETCVNSKHKARFLAKEGEDYCQCSFGECKVRTLIAYNGHEPYEYILTKNEVKEAKQLLGINSITKK